MIKNQNLYEKILDNLYEGVYIVDKNRKIIFWNKSAERITGFKNFEVLGKRCSENILIHNIFIGNSKIQVTVSIGATLIKKNDTINKLLKRVDSLMYQSKKLGKNRVSVKI